MGVIALLFVATAALARAPSPWNEQAENAALKVGNAARQLAKTAGVIGGEGRIGHLTVLRSDAEDLVRRADALARMAQEPLPEDLADDKTRGASSGARPKPR